MLVEMPDGTTFSVGTGFSDAEREAPPAVGSVITYRYQELSEAGVPRFPSYIGMRGDAPAPATPTKAASKPVQGDLPMMTTTTPAASTRRFEFTEGSSSKFWEVTVSGKEMTVRYGRIGSTGQSSVKSFTDGAAATKQAEKLINEKLGKGYREVS